ncbi:ras-related protein Rab-34-like isoform X2 [Phyllopteryx taeniolatus]|uniref:ras-related protein Rab-34-like isoform X2 n=1 Tax=Phyllopteryx taeniolatus TaxID=161469 RepID=UPI002AD2F473|nr:ras-related protein Rab-34-like isoform X2 [Phyllopteryx taeniolatus]
MHVFGMWDETGVPRKKPTQARTERTCKLHKANPGPQNSQAVTSILTRAWTWTWIQCNIMLLPTKSDRIITDLPKCFSPKAALQTKEVFHTQVQAACQTHREDAVRFCTGAFDKNYKATIGVDFDMERFQVLGVPFSLQLWDTAGQERFKCIASTYYRGAQAIIVVFDLSRGSSLVHARQWLEDALKENDPSGVLLFLVGTKKDLSSPEELAQVEQGAVRMSEELRAEYWAVSAKSGVAHSSSYVKNGYIYTLRHMDNIQTNKHDSVSTTGDGVRDFFFRVASLTFEANVLSELEKQHGNTADIISESPLHFIDDLTEICARSHVQMTTICLECRLLVGTFLFSTAITM